MTKKAKTPARNGGAKKAAPLMRRKSKRASALPHVDVTAPKRKPIQSQVADGAMQPRAVKAQAKIIAELAASVMSSIDLGAPASKPATKPSLWDRFRSAITGRWVSDLFAKRNPDTTMRERIR